MAQGLPTRMPINRGSTLFSVAGAQPHPWQIRQKSTTPNADLKCEVLAPSLFSTFTLSGGKITPTGAADLELAADKQYWLTATFTESGVAENWSITTQDPTDDLVKFSSASPPVQEGLWYLLARVISGTKPDLPGFDFKIDTADYHLEQLANTRLFLSRVAINGKSAWYPRPF